MTCRRTGYPTRDDPLPTSSIRGRPNTDRALSSAFSTLAPGPTSPTAATPGHPLSRPSASSSRHGNSMAPVPRTGHTLMHRPALGRQQASASQLAQRSLYSCNPRHLIAATPIVNKQRKPPGFRWNPGGCARRRRDLNPRGAMHPYLLSREAHSTGLCDVSSADYSRPFSPRARTAPAARAQQAVGSAEGEGFEPPVPLLTQRFSRPSLSATQTALQTRFILQDRGRGCESRVPGPGPMGGSMPRS